MGAQVQSKGKFMFRVSRIVGEGNGDQIAYDQGYRDFEQITRDHY